MTISGVQCLSRALIEENYRSEVPIGLRHLLERWEQFEVKCRFGVMCQTDKQQSAAQHAALFLFFIQSQSDIP